VIVQTTLLGVAFAIILALIAALVGPFLVDWTQFRSAFEAEASRVIGLPVRVKGAIDARLLPSPSLTVHGIEIGEPKEEQALKARLLNVEFALGALIRGEFRAVEAQLSGPELTVAIDRSGAVNLPKLSGGFVPDTLSIERLTIEDGRAQVVNAVTGSRTTLENVWFNGDLRSLTGPFKGEGAFVLGGELFGYRISAGRLGDDGKLRLKLSLDPSDRPLTAEADGSLVLGDGKPRFEGTVALSRPAGLLVATGQSNKVKPPWRVTSRVNIAPAGAKLEHIDFQYGAEDSGVHLTGTAELRLGRQPLLKGVLSARQLDLDRLLATPDKPLVLPAEALKRLIAGYADALQSPIQTELSISADTVTLGGGLIQLFGADLRLGADSWALDRVEFRAPGLSQVNFSGQLDLVSSPSFRGPLMVETNDPGTLAGWLSGRNDPATRIRPFKARGEVVLSQTEIAVEHLKAQVDRKLIEGRLRYVIASAAQPSRLDAELRAPELDLDALLAFAEGALSGTALTPPSEIALSIAIERARIAGVEAKTLQAQVKRDAKLLLVERLSVADLGGANLIATGRVDTTGAAPRGSLALDVDARALDGVIALAAKFAPPLAEPLRRASARVPGAKLQITLALDGPEKPSAAAKTSVRFAAEGRVAGLRASLHGQARQDSTRTTAEGLSAFAGSDVRFEAQMDGEDGSALVALLGLDKIVTVDRQPGFVSIAVNGKLDDALSFDTHVLAGGLDGKASGTVRVPANRGPSAEFRLEIAKANVRPIVAAGERVRALPLTLRSRVSLTEREAKLVDLKGTLAGTDLRGVLTIGYAEGLTIAGHIEADALDAAAAIAAAIGAPPETRAARGGPAGWSAEPYAAGQFGDLAGRIELKVMRAALTPSLPARQLQTAIVFRGPEIVLDDFEAHVAGGRLAGRLMLRRGGEGLAVRAHIELSNIDAAAALPGDLRPSVEGRLSGKLDLDASGLSPKALVGSLAGSGTLTLEDGYFASLSPQVFDAIIRASDQGLAVGTSKIRDIVSAALNSGRLRISNIGTTLTINAGQVRMVNTTVAADGVQLGATGSLDLIQQQIDARLTLSGPPPGDRSAERPDIYIGLKGPIAAPHRTLDVSALAGWLTVRRIDQQAKKLEALEEAARAQEAARAREAAAQAKRREEISSVPASPKQPEPSVAAVPAAPPVVAPPATASTAPRAPTTRPGEALRDSGVPQIVRPEPGSSAAIARPPANTSPPSTQAPPLPAPVEIRRVPRGPTRAQENPERRPTEPLQLPSSRPTWLDSLIGAPR
jgi:large subunit ribosomal protein L24